MKYTVSETLSNSNGHAKNGRRRDKLEDSLGRMLYKETRRRPMIFSIINER